MQTDFEISPSHLRSLRPSTLEGEQNLVMVITVLENDIFKVQQQRILQSNSPCLWIIARLPYRKNCVPRPFLNGTTALDSPPSKLSIFFFQGFISFEERSLNDTCPQLGLRIIESDRNARYFNLYFQCHKENTIRIQCTGLETEISETDENHGISKCFFFIFGEP